VALTGQVDAPARGTGDRVADRPDPPGEAGDVRHAGVDQRHRGPPARQPGRRHRGRPRGLAVHRAHGTGALR
jgi:hypothetical protein